MQRAPRNRLPSATASPLPALDGFQLYAFLFFGPGAGHVRNAEAARLTSDGYDRH